LQNIPASDEFRKDVRNGFIATEGFTLVACDYSQIELRVAAILSGEPNFIKVFKDGGDIHTAVAARVFNVDEAAITPDMRRQAKVINFGIIYGMGVNALRENLGSDRASAQEFYNTYFERFPGLRDYLDSVKMNALKKGYTETLFGRRRYFPALKSKLPFIRAQAERMAINAPIQGTATADIIKLALIHVSARLEKESLDDKVFPLLQVHDELVFEIADDVLDRAKVIIREEMEYILQNSFLHYDSPVPLVVDINTAKAWGEMKK
jgi:DNA polymerase-1